MGVEEVVDGVNEVLDGKKLFGKEKKEVGLEEVWKESNNRDLPYKEFDCRCC